MGKERILARPLVNKFVIFIFFYDCLIIRNVREFGSFVLVCCLGPAWSLRGFLLATLLDIFFHARNLMKRKIFHSQHWTLTIVFIVDINTILISLTPFPCHLTYHSTELKSSFDIQISRFSSRRCSSSTSPFSDVNETLCYANYVANERNLIYFSSSRVLCSSVAFIIYMESKYTSIVHSNGKKSSEQTAEHVKLVSERQN